jgi:hypothetical protein
MEHQVEDQPVLNHIQHLVAEEHRLHEQRVHPQADRKRLVQVQVELDQCWTSCASDVPCATSGLTRTTRKFVRRRLSRIMSSRDWSSASGR